MVLPSCRLRRRVPDTKLHRSSGSTALSAGAIQQAGITVELLWKGIGKRSLRERRRLRTRRGTRERDVQLQDLAAAVPIQAHDHVREVDPLVTRDDSQQLLLQLRQVVGATCPRPRPL